MNLAGAFELRRAMTAGEPLYFDPAASCTRTRTQHHAEIRNAIGRARGLQQVIAQMEPSGRPTRNLRRLYALALGEARRLRMLRPEGDRS